MTTGTSPVQSFNGADVSTAADTRRQTDLNLRATKNSLKELGLNVDNANADVDSWLRQNQNNPQALELYEAYEGLSQQLQQSNQFLQQVNQGFVSQNPKYWEDRFADLQQAGWFERFKGKLPIKDAEGNTKFVKMENAEDLQNLVINNKMLMKEQGVLGQVWDDVTDFLEFRDETGTFGLGTINPLADRWDPIKMAEDPDARWVIQQMVDEAYSDLRDYAEEEEGLSSNVTIVRPTDESKLGQVRNLIQDVAQDNSVLFKSLEGAGTLEDYLTENNINRKNIRINLTDGAAASGNPVVWISSVNDDGTADKKGISKGFEYLDETGRTSQALSELIIAAGQANQNAAQVRLGERVAANPIITKLRATGLTQSPSTVAMVKSQGTVTNTIPGYNGQLKLMVTAPNQKLHYTLLHEENGKWVPMTLTTASPEGGTLDANNKGNTRMSSYNLATLSWLMYKELRADQTGTAYDPYSKTFIPVQ